MTAASDLAFLAGGGEMGRRIAVHDWASTPVGPVRAWSPALRTAVALVLESPHPMLVWWGPQLTVLHNDAFAALDGDGHPARLGRPGEEAFGETWPGIGPALRRVLAEGEATRVDDHLLVRHRDGVGEETYRTSAHSPVREPGGRAGGVLTVTHDTTDRVVPARRLATLRALRDATAGQAADAEQAVRAALAVLAADPLDLPFAFACLDDGTGLRLAGSYGVPDEALLHRLVADPAGAVRHVHTTGEPAVRAGLAARYAGAIPAPLDGPLGARPPDTAVVLPLAAAGSDRPGVLVLGVAPYRPLDADHRAFLDLVAGHVALAARRRRAEAPAERALHAERERYRTLVEQAPVGIWTADAQGRTTFVNDRIAELAGRSAEEIRRAGRALQLHPEDREAVQRAWTAAVATGADWAGDYRVLDATGVVRHLSSSARPLRDEQGAVTGYLGTTVDVTDERQAEHARRETAAVQAAREVSDAAAARLRAMVGGLAAIVWEADWDAEARQLRFTFVSERAEELLGHPLDRWLADPGFWPGLVHPDDRAATVEAALAHTAEGRDHDLVYRAVAADGRTVWLHQVVHVLRDADGRPLRAQGLTVDVTVQARAERATALLAESGRLLTDAGTPEQRLEALARMLMGELADAAIVSVIGPDGLLRRIAVAHPEPAAERSWLNLAPSKIPPPLAEMLAPGRPVVVPVTDELLSGAARDDADREARYALGARSLLLVPLVAADRLLGVLGLVAFGRERGYDDADLELAAELGRRAALMVEADRRRTRERHLQAVTADLASSGSVAEAAQRLAARLATVLGASALSVYQHDPGRGLQLVHSIGYRAEVLEEFALIRLDDAVPLATAARTGNAVWLRDRADWLRGFSHLVPSVGAAGRNAAAALPLVANGRMVGAIGVSFVTEREFPDDEREFVGALAAQAAPAFERAATADRRRMIAETLQDSLLPPELPRLERLELAARYLPGARGAATGGDWYDVIRLDARRVAVAVGDVVGHGARAAAVMGQLRSALSGYLLEGHGPVRALEHLDRFAARVPGAVGSTVACLVLDTGTGELVWARAGHPPPLVVDADGARHLVGGGGTVLGVRGRPPYVAGRTRIDPGVSVVLYTDGLVEVRHELIDTGLDRLAAAAHRHHALAPDPLAAALLADTLPGPAPTDDVALIVARLLPAPLALTLPGDPGTLRSMRAQVQRWAGLTGLAEDTGYDLQLVLGEAAANVVEHAYGDGPPGPLHVALARAADGGVRGEVRDEGRWRPEPADKGYRGRGLQLMSELAADVTIERGGPGTAGTTVSFALAPDRAAAAAPPVDGPGGGPGPAAAPTTLYRSGPADAARIAVLGDLDLAGVRAVRAELLADLRGVVTLDLTGTAYLASAGVALITEVERAARAAGGTLRVLVRAGGVVRRVLALSGLDRVVVVDTDSGTDVAVDST